MLRAEVLETMLYGCVTWSPRACHYETLRRALHRFLTRCIGWRKHDQLEVIVVVCAAFGLTVLEAKTEIMCLRAKGMPEFTAAFSVEAVGQVYNQTNEFVYLGGNVNHNVDLSIEADRRIRNAWCSFRKYTLEL